MMIMNDAHSYATRDTAVAKLNAALGAFGIEASARTVIIVNSQNRYAPAVLQSSIDPAYILPLVNRKISVIG